MGSVKGLNLLGKWSENMAGTPKGESFGSGVIPRPSSEHPWSRKVAFPREQPYMPHEGLLTDDSCSLECRFQGMTPAVPKEMQEVVKWPSIGNTIPIMACRAFAMLPALRSRSCTFL